MQLWEDTAVRLISFVNIELWKYTAKEPNGCGNIQLWDYIAVGLYAIMGT